MSSDTTPGRSVHGLSVLVTGGAEGIGAACARLFAAAGARVCLGDIDADRAADAARAIRAKGGQAFARHLDVADSDQIATVARTLTTEFGGLDILINNAGFVARAALDDAAYDDVWDRALGTMLSAHQKLTRALLPCLRKSSSPRIVNIASSEALTATAGMSAYAAAKAGVVGLTRALAVELGPEAITVNCVCPGPVLTQMTRAISADARETFARRRTALRRFGTPDEIADIVLSIALPSASYITGAIIVVDGGLTVRNT